jgi:large subunit ribosomal protein L13
VDTLSYKTISANVATVEKAWVVVDAENQIVGRLTSEIAKILSLSMLRKFVSQARK